MKVQDNKLIHCGLYVRNLQHVPDTQVNTSGIGCAWYELDPETGSLLENMQAPVDYVVHFAKDFVPHSHAVWSEINTNVPLNSSIGVVGVSDFVVGENNDVYLMTHVRRGLYGSYHLDFCT